MRCTRENLEIWSNEVLDLANRVKLSLRGIVRLDGRNEKDISIRKSHSRCATTEFQSVKAEKGPGKAPDRVCDLSKFGLVSHAVQRRLLGWENSGVVILAESMTSTLPFAFE